MEKVMRFIRTSKLLKFAGIVLFVYLTAMVVSACKKKSSGSEYGSTAYGSRLVIAAAQEVVPAGQKVSITFSEDKAGGYVYFIENTAEAVYSRDAKQGYITLKKEGSVSFFIEHLYTMSVSSGKSSSTITVKSPSNIVTIRADSVLVPVGSAEEFQNMNPDGFYRLAGDIDFSGINFKPFETFGGMLRGGGYSIKNLILDSSDSEKVGIFKTLTGAVEDVNFTGCYIATQKYAGSAGIIAGVNKGEIRNCSVSGGISVTKGNNIGGIAGICEGAITGCENAASVSGGAYVGGIAGCVKKSAKLTGLTNRGRVSGGSSTGGVIGLVESPESASLDSYKDIGKLLTNYGAVSGTIGVGGIAGSAAKASFGSCQNYGAVTGRSYTAGIAGLGYEFNNCENEGKVAILNLNGIDSVLENYNGGIAGKCYSAQNCTNTGKIDFTDVFAVKPTHTGVAYVGGIAGYAESKSTGNTNSGNVRGRFHVGGIFGEYTAAELDNCENNGDVIAEAGAAGGIAGTASNSSAAVKNCVNKGGVTGVSAGGVAGAGKSFSLCRNEGAVTGTNDTGGIAGTASAVENCENSGGIKATGTNAGGIAGTAATVKTSKNLGAVAGGSNYTGGIAGISATEINGCENLGEVAGTLNTGGIAGQGKLISNCTNTAKVTGGGNTGGIAGQIADTANNAKNENNANRGAVAGGDSTGGIAGYVNGGSFSANSNFGKITSDGINVAGVFGKAEQLRAAEQCINRGDVTGVSNVGGIIGARKSSVNTSVISNCANYGALECGASGVKTEITGTAYA